MPEFKSTPQENHIAEDKVRASSSSSSLFTLNLPNGLHSKVHISQRQMLLNCIQKILLIFSQTSEIFRKIFLKG